MAKTLRPTSRSRDVLLVSYLAPRVDLRLVERVVYIGCGFRRVRRSKKTGWHLKLLVPPVENLDRQVSQMIEHGALDAEIGRVELKLRLADLESALDAATQLPNPETLSGAAGRLVE